MGHRYVQYCILFWFDQQQLTPSMCVKVLVCRPPDLKAPLLRWTNWLPLVSALKGISNPLLCFFELFPEVFRAWCFRNTGGLWGPQYAPSLFSKNFLKIFHAIAYRATGIFSFFFLIFFYDLCIVVFFLMRCVHCQFFRTSLLHVFLQCFDC